MYSVAFLLIAAFAAAHLLTPIVCRWSHRRGLLDHPDERRKLHRASVPRTGGVAIVAAYLAAIALLLLSPLHGADAVSLPLAIRLLPAVLVVFVIGLTDDLIGLNPRQKLLGQTAAAFLAWWAGVQLTGVAGMSVPGWWGLPLTVFWLVGCANALNLIDGVDGLASGIALFAASTTLVAALLQGNTPLALATAPLLGALLAFLRYNFSPASIFLGDSGSLTVGFLLGCFGVIWSQKAATALGMAAPLMALAVPLLDTGVSVVRRFLRHQSVFSSDRNHVHHRLLDRGFSPRKVALSLYVACGLGAAFSLAAGVQHGRFSGVLLIAFCVVAWIGVHLVGYVELDAARHLALSGTFRHIVNARLSAATFERHISSASTREDYWNAIRAVSREVGCLHVRLSLDGIVFEDGNAVQGSTARSVVRVPLERGYVNFAYPVQSSVKHVSAISSLVEIIQRSPLPAIAVERLPAPHVPAALVAQQPESPLGRPAPEHASLS